MFKAAVTSSFIPTADELNMYNVKSVACSDEPTKNYHPSVLQSFLALFWF